MYAVQMEKSLSVAQQVMAGVDLRTVQELMGHKTIQMTVRYVHLAPKHQLAAVQRLCGGETAVVTTKRIERRFQNQESTEHEDHNNMTQEPEIACHD